MSRLKTLFEDEATCDSQEEQEQRTPDNSDDDLTLEDLKEIFGDVSFRCLLLPKPFLKLRTLFRELKRPSLINPLLLALLLLRVPRNSIPSTTTFSRQA